VWRCRGTGPGGRGVGAGRAEGWIVELMYLLISKVIFGFVTQREGGEGRELREERRKEGGRRVSRTTYSG
jgi:hypothetical protein